MAMLCWNRALFATMAGILCVPIFGVAILVGLSYAFRWPHRWPVSSWLGTLGAGCPPWRARRRVVVKPELLLVRVAPTGQVQSFGNVPYRVGCQIASRLPVSQTITPPAVRDVCPSLQVRPR